MEKRIIFFSAFFVLICILFFGGYSLITGKSVFGSISLGVLNSAVVINISSPENTTYNFDKFDIFLINLNVSASSAIDSWQFSLYDIRHDLFAYRNITFIPNTTFQAVRWSNRIIVQGNDSISRLGTNEVEFIFNVSDS
ncbi:MAG: hypothetical protein AABY05_02210, partial [Nanoarchaeota archaeon]